MRSGPGTFSPGGRSRRPWSGRRSLPVRWPRPARSPSRPLLDRLDGEGQRSGGHAHGDPVALLVTHQRAPDRRVDGDASGRRIALHRADEVVRLALAFVVDDLDRRSGARHAGVRVADDLGAADHLLQLVDPAVQETDLFLRLFVLGVVLDVARLEGLLQSLARLAAPAQRDLEVALELLEPFRCQQYRFG